MKKRKLSEDIKYWRAERPDEWTMDEFIRAAQKLERELSELRKDKERLDWLLDNAIIQHYPASNPDYLYRIDKRKDIDKEMKTTNQWHIYEKTKRNTDGDGDCIYIPYQDLGCQGLPDLLRVQRWFLEKA